MSRNILPGLAIFALLGVTVVIRADDELKQFEARRQVAAEKLKSQVNEAIESSRKLEKKDPLEARTRVERTLRQVRDSQDTNLQEKEKDTLARRLQTRLNELDNGARQQKVEQDLKPARNIDKPRLAPPGLDPVGGVSGLAKQRIDAAKGIQGATQASTRDREKNLAKIYANNGASTIPTDEDYTLPKYWKQLSESRKKMFGPQLSEKEVAILKTLNSTITVEYKGDRYKDVLNHLQDKTGLTLIMDQASVQDLNLDYDDLFTLPKLNKVTVRTALKKILGDKGLTYIIKEGALQVMTPKRAADQTIVRSYPIDGLIAPTQMAQMYGPFVARAQMLNNAQQLINMIQSTIEPSYWQPNGPGMITFYEPTMSLSIRASAEMHYQLPGMIGR